MGEVKKITIIGVGLIGGSIGMALKQKAGEIEITGYDAATQTLDDALKLRAIDKAATSIDCAVREADLVLIATPVSRILDIAINAIPHMKPAAILTDVGSAKLMIARGMKRLLAGRNGPRYVGAHPMTGSEKGGVLSASAWLMENAVTVLTVEEDTDREALETLREVFHKTGSTTIELDAETHDSIVAAVSHLPYLVAISLLNTVAELEHRCKDALRLAAGGFKDTTRIGSSEPGMWKDICFANKEMLLDVVRTFKNELDKLTDYISSGKGDEFVRLAHTARCIRANIPQYQKGLIDTEHEIIVIAPDRPGVIGAVATKLGEAGINIKDFEILKIREDEGGTFRITLETSEDSLKALEVLAQAGYECRKR